MGNHGKSLCCDTDKSKTVTFIEALLSERHNSTHHSSCLLHVIAVNVGSQPVFCKGRGNSHPLHQGWQNHIWTLIYKFLKLWRGTNVEVRGTGFFFAPRKNTQGDIKNSRTLLNKKSRVSLNNSNKSKIRSFSVNGCQKIATYLVRNT